MSYFGGMGSGKGWNKFQFILTPDEFQGIFEGLKYSFVKTGSRVAINYYGTDCSEIFSSYQSFFDQVLIGQKELSRQKKGQLESGIRISAIDDIRKICYEGITDENGATDTFKLVQPQEPVINISPFYLTLTRDNKLSTAFLNEDGIIGLELTYPKVVSWKAEEFGVYHDTKQYAAHQLYEELTKRIKELTHKATVRHGETVFKPNFRVSDSVAAQINVNVYLKRNGLVTH